MSVILGAVWDFVFPRFCVVCGREGAFLCRKCKKGLPAALQVCPMCTAPSIYGLTHDYCGKKLGMEGLIAIFDYKNEAVRRVIEAVKFGFNRELVSVVLSGWKMPEGFKRAELVPVPLHRLRENWRGFNQAELIAKHLGKKTAVVNGLARTRATGQQARAVSRRWRAENIKGAFGLSRAGENLAGRRVVLVDDVFTSGATMRECAKVLKKAGVRQVWGLVLAR